MPRTVTAGRLIVDSSALLCRYLPDRRQPFVDELLGSADQVVVTALARTEVELGLHQALGASPSAGVADAASRFERDWHRFWILPIDQRSMHRASDLGRTYGLNLVNSLHLAAFERVPRPATLLTVDDRQFAVADDLGFDIVDVEGREAAHRLLRTDG